MSNQQHLNLLDMAVLCELARSINEPTIFNPTSVEQQKLFQKINKDIDFFENKTMDSEMIITTTLDNNTIIFTFRSTDSKKNIKQDLNAIPILMDDDICIHSGFFKYYKSMEDHLVKEINEFRGDTVIFNGHSLGGAASVLAGYYMADKISDKHLKVITFGSPRVGNKLFVEEFEKKVTTFYRIANARDPICYLPPTIFLYAHCNKQLFLVDGHKITYKEPKESFFRNIKNFLLQILNIEYHDLSIYKTNINSHKIMYKLAL